MSDDKTFAEYTRDYVQASEAVMKMVREAEVGGRFGWSSTQTALFAQLTHAEEAARAAWHKAFHDRSVPN